MENQFHVTNIMHLQSYNLQAMLTGETLKG